jgi:hypothetical protein
MRRSKSIVDVVFRQAGELLRESLVIGFFLGMKAQVFQQQRLAFLELARNFLGFWANTLRAKADVFAAGQLFVEQHAQTLGHGLETHLRIGLSFRTSEMRGKNQARPMAKGILDGGQGLADTSVVHDAAVFERHVKINAHEDTMITQREIANRKLGHGWSSVTCSALLRMACRVSGGHFTRHLEDRSFDIRKPALPIRWFKVPWSPGS